MKRKLSFAWLLIYVVVFFAACAPTGEYVNREYTLPVETGAFVQQEISLEDYRIQEGAMIALGDLISIKDMVLESVCFYDEDNLLMIFLNGDGTRLDAYLFSLDNASLSWLGTIENLSQVEDLGSNYTVVQLEPLVIMNEYTNNIWVIKDKIVQHKITLDLANVRSIAIGDNKAFYTHIGNDAIECIDFTSGLVETLYTGLNDYSFNINEVTQVSDDGQYLYATGINKLNLHNTTFVFDLEQDKIVAEVEGAYDCWDSDEYMYSSYVDSQKYIVHQRTEDNYTNVEVGEIVPYSYFEYFITEDDFVITEENENGIYTFTYYDLAEMEKIKSTNIDIHSYFMYQYSQGCNYSYCSINNEFGYNAERNMLVYMVRTDEGLSNVFLWDIESAEKVGMALAGDSYSEEMDFQDVNEMDYDELSDLVHVLYDKYGIGIYVGANTPTTFTDFAAVREEDLEKIAVALTEVQEVLQCYPEGFFKFFTEEDYLSGINVYLVGNITSVSEGYIDNPFGFANIASGYEVIAININYTNALQETLVHEISHAIYERILYEEATTGTQYFDENKWNNLNPANFEYHNTYVDAAGNDITALDDGSHTANAYATGDNVNDVYFIDDYSKTFLTEDLARLMQYGMMRSEEEYMDSNKIIAKLNFYYASIRSVWDSEDWPAKTDWESKLSN